MKSHFINRFLGVILSSGTSGDSDGNEMHGYEGQVSVPVAAPIPERQEITIELRRPEASTAQKVLAGAVMAGGVALIAGIVANDARREGYRRGFDVGLNQSNPRS